jgi:two-component system, NtrC family, response regulator
VGSVQPSDLIRHASLSDGSSQMRAIATIIENVADTDATVLIRGESGVGKDLVAKLLHVLQDFRFSRVGGNGSIDVDSRVIAATNRNLEEAMARGEFREDLYYRVNVVEIRVPPLRERREEIPALASWFREKFNAQYGRQKQLSPETMSHLQQHSWSGNVRELENVVRRLVVLMDGEREIEALAARQSANPRAGGPSP